MVLREPYTVLRHVLVFPDHDAVVVLARASGGAGRVRREIWGRDGCDGRRGGGVGSPCGPGGSREQRISGERDTGQRKADGAGSAHVSRSNLINTLA